MIKKISTYLIAGVMALASTSALADESPFEFSANVAFTTDYLFRGITLSNDNAAVSGGFDVGYGGFYVGTWASSISPVEDETVEIDLYGGYAGEFSGISYSLDFIYYGYPGEMGAPTVDLDYYEFGGSLGYTFAASMDPTIGISILHSPDFFGETGDATAYEGTFDLSLPYDIGLSAHYGFQDFEKSKTGIDGYEYYGVDISKTWSIFDFTVGYSDTDSDGDTFEGDDTQTIVFTISSSF